MGEREEKGGEEIKKGVIEQWEGEEGGGKDRDREEKRERWDGEVEKGNENVGRGRKGGGECAKQR